MKKALTILAMSMIAVAATAQDMYDALTFSQNNYQGTARSMGMGNAMTAVGSDLGSVGINPAGSAVAGYGQITLTPNVTLVTTNSSYTPVYGQNYTNKTSDAFSRFTLPNAGFMLNFDTGRKRGIKSWTLGMVSNVTNDFGSTAYAGGNNEETSILGAFAAAASTMGISATDLANSNAYYNTSAPWVTIAAYHSGMISTYGGSQYNFIGTTEKLYGGTVIALAGELDQQYSYQRKGAKKDVIINWGANINDMLFIGANLGITAFNLQSSLFFQERALDPSNFDVEYTSGDIAYFDHARYGYAYNAEGDGAYLKIGAIYKPTPSLRIGAAIQTPTNLLIYEKWQYICETNFTESKYDGAASSPEGEYRYRLVSPYRVNAGIAYNILGMAMISADYEMTDYSTMKYKNYDNDYSNFSDVNSTIADYCGVGHMVRVGAEVKPLPQYAIRAGYNFTTSGEYVYENNVKKSAKDNLHAFSIGLGYSSNKAFFADVAYKLSLYPARYLAPYNDYIEDGSGNISVYSPEIMKKESMHNIIATVGFRF